ncbi:MAG: MSMEG_0568 family radical SAM protein [Candidatus Limnocylindrales bacterium]
MESETEEQLVVELQTKGARIDVPIDSIGRRGGAGPTDDKAFLLPGQALMVPTMAPSVATTPYSVVESGAGYVISRDGTPVAPVAFPRRPRFHDFATADGVPYSHLAVVHGTDVLATTVVQTCIRWSSESDRCQFCGIGISLQNGATIPVKTPAQLAEVAEAAVRLDGVKHFVLTMGTINETDKGARYMAKCVRSVKAAVDIPIEVQFEPPDDLEVLTEVRDAGADSIGIHLEAFDQAVRERILPGKARISVDYYFTTLRRAVELFGVGQVSSYIIVGLGESPASIIAGCQRLVDIGVFPFVVPLRPILGTGMQDATPPSPEIMTLIYRAVAGMLELRGMSHADSKAGCARCGACSGLPTFTHRPPVDWGSRQHPILE